MIYEVVYDTDSFCDGFDTPSIEQGKYDALDLLIEWKCQDHDWYGVRMPTEQEIEDWDYMIFNCSVEVVQYDESEIEDGCPNYETVWEPSYEDEKSIGWLEWDEMKDDYAAMLAAMEELRRMSK